MLQWLLLWWLCGIVAAGVAIAKGRSGFGYFLLGMIAGPLAWIIFLQPRWQVRLAREDDPDPGPQTRPDQRPVAEEFGSEPPA